MRTFLLAAIAALALPAAALAQSQTPSMMQAPLPSPESGGVYRGAGLDADSGSTYDFKIMMLKKKMDRLTRQDGGQLTAAHQAELQKELDALNHRFRYARR